MISLFIIVQIVLAVIITLLVLVQKSSEMGFSSSSSNGNNSFFGSKGAGGFVVKLTFLFAFLFIINTIYLGYSLTQSKSNSVLNKFKEPSALAKIVDPDSNKGNKTTNSSKSN